MSLECNGEDRVCSLRKIPTRLRGTKFCTSLARFELSVVTQQTVPNAPKSYQMQRNIRLGSNGMAQVLCCEKFRHDFMARSFAPLQPVLHHFSPFRTEFCKVTKWYETQRNLR